MFDESFGLPTHALVVHAVVVLLPLAALGAVLIAVLPRLRERYGLLVGLVTLAAVASVPVATQSGEKLYERQSARFGPGDVTEAGLMQEHADLGEKLLPWALVLLVGVALVLLVPALTRSRVPAGGGPADRASGGPADRADRPGWVTPVALLAAAITLVGAVGTGVMVAKIGHAGSKAAWERLNQPAAISAPVGPAAR